MNSYEHLYETEDHIVWCKMQGAWSKELLIIFRSIVEVAKRHRASLILNDLTAVSYGKYFTQMSVAKNFWQLTEMPLDFYMAIVVSPHELVKKAKEEMEELLQVGKHKHVQFFYDEREARVWLARKQA